MSQRQLEGNGAGLIRERALAGRVQGALERVYQLDRLADVGDFVSDEPGREQLLLREAEDGAIEMRLHLPAFAREADLDEICQVIEGVSHFVYVVERARMQHQATQLELELQAEVDKWVVLAESTRGFDAERSAELRTRLYEKVTFGHAPGTELGERYRVANEAANRFVRRLERDFVAPSRFDELRHALRHFFRESQEQKLRLCRSGA